MGKVCTEVPSEGQRLYFPTWPLVFLDGHGHNTAG